MPVSTHRLFRNNYWRPKWEVAKNVREGAKFGDLATLAYSLALPGTTRRHWIAKQNPVEQKIEMDAATPIKQRAHPGSSVVPKPSSAPTRAAEISSTVRKPLRWASIDWKSMLMYSGTSSATLPAVNMSSFC
jgi:hypothetical protein